MSGLFTSLSASVKALNAQSAGLEAAGRNIANVNNTNYARQRVIFGDRGTIMTATGPQSMGIEAMGVQQIRDSLMDQQVLREVSLQAALTTSQAGLQKAQAGLGEQIDRTSSTNSTSGGTHGISESLADFFNTFQSYAASPTDVGVKQTLIQKSSVLVDGFNLTDARLAQTQNDLTTQASADVDSVNTVLKSIADLNGQISRLELNAPGSAIDLRDTRQAKLEELAGKISFETRPDPSTSGAIQVFVRDDSVPAHELALVDKTTAATLSYSSVTGGVQFSGLDLTGAAPVANANVVLAGGSIKGALDARDGAVQTLRDNIDALAAQLVSAVNTLYSPTGSNYFDPAGTTAGTIKLATGLTDSTLKASVGGAAGDNTVAQQIADLASKTFSTTGVPPDLIDGTLSQHFNRAVTNLGQTLSGISTRLNDQTTITQLVRSQRDAVSGVSLDEEMADLMKFQRAFQASSRVFTTIDSLLDTVVNGLIR
jgi:flagellar hook-associated protein 1